MNKLPVTQTVAESYRFTFGGLGTVIGLIWLPIVIPTVGGYFTLVPYFSGTAAPAAFAYRALTARQG